MSGKRNVSVCSGHELAIALYIKHWSADNQAEYLEACIETRKLSEEARYKKVEEFLANLENNHDPARMWIIITSLWGAPSSPILAEFLQQTTTQPSPFLWMKTQPENACTSTKKKWTASDSWNSRLNRRPRETNAGQWWWGNPQDVRQRRPMATWYLLNVPQSSRTKSETGAAENLQPQLLNLEVAPNLEEHHYHVALEIEKNTRMHIFIHTNQSNILCGKNTGENPPWKTVLPGGSHWLPMYWTSGLP